MVAISSKCMQLWGAYAFMLIFTSNLQEILNELEKAINDRELLEVLQAERDDVPYVKASANRLQKDDYERIVVGNYKEKARNRTTTQARQRKKYEVIPPPVAHNTFPMLVDHIHASAADAVADIPFVKNAGGNNCLSTVSVRKVSDDVVGVCRSTCQTFTSSTKIVLATVKNICTA